MFASHHPALFAAMSRFVGEHCAIESTAVAETAISNIATAESLDAAAAAPMLCGALDFVDSLKWLFFVHTGARVAREAKTTDSVPLQPLDLSSAFSVAAAVFDVAVEAVVWDHFDVDAKNNISVD